MVFGWEDRPLIGFYHDGKEFAHYYFLLGFVIGVVVSCCIDLILTFSVGVIINAGID